MLSLETYSSYVWSLKASNGRRQARSDTLRSRRDREVWQCHLGPFSADPPVHVKNLWRLLPVPAQSLGLKIQLHLCSMFLWSPEPDPELGTSIERVSVSSPRSSQTGCTYAQTQRKILHSFYHFEIWGVLWDPTKRSFNSTSGETRSETLLEKMDVWMLEVARTRGWGGEWLE